MLGPARLRGLARQQCDRVGIERIGDQRQRRRRDSVLSRLVFLQLLKRDPDERGHMRLRQPQFEPPGADPLTNLFVRPSNGTGGADFFCHFGYYQLCSCALCLNG